jgi:hypothetical protein
MIFWSVAVSPEGRKRNQPLCFAVKNERKVDRIKVFPKHSGYRKDVKNCQVTFAIYMPGFRSGCWRVVFVPRLRALWYPASRESTNLPALAPRVESPAILLVGRWPNRFTKAVARRDRRMV